jgi:hypothetical protein
MMNSRRPLLGVLSILVCWTGTHTIATETTGTGPYQEIVVRNVFGLNPPKAQPGPEANKPPPPIIFLQGITTIGATAKALFKVQMPPKPGEPPKGEQSFILGEGQRDGEIEVLEIDAKAGTVKVDDFGTITNLNFENNGIKTAGAPAPSGGPKPAGFVPSAPPPSPFAPPTGANPIPTARPMRLPPTSAAASPSSYGGTAAVANNDTARSLTTYTAVPTTTAYGSSATSLTVPGGTPAPTTGMAQKSWPPEMQMTPEESAIHEAAYMLQYQNQIKNGTMPSIPGSNPLLESGTTSGQTPTTLKAQ